MGCDRQSIEERLQVRKTEQCVRVEGDVALQHAAEAALLVRSRLSEVHRPGCGDATTIS